MKAAILDFDGTLIRRDMLDELCERMGRRAQSEELNRRFRSGELPGITGLVERINLIEGLPLEVLAQVIEEDRALMPGALDLFAFLRTNNVITIIASGSILPVLQYYKGIFQADYALGPSPKIIDGALGRIEAEDIPEGFKLRWSKKLLEDLGVLPEEAFAIGDSPSELGLFEYSGFSIAIEPKGGIERHANISISSDLREAITHLKRAFVLR